MKRSRALFAATVLLTAAIGAAAIGQMLAANVIGAAFVVFWTLWGVPHPMIGSTEGGAC
jgi:hypothetical protein